MDIKDEQKMSMREGMRLECKREGIRLKRGDERESDIGMNEGMRLKRENKWENDIGVNERGNEIEEREWVREWYWSEWKRE